ncbi:putative DNA-binding transcriptional regulator YafY [Streptomyces sp. Amel2xB2]|uniref:helix-turn-helix transcriptional regulator n=1 Tax=Streptomyces sp. Amel2xB2 TaxID=1305829 RepID=UPI000DB9D51E|nr:YafY family protein [Streptomyces sp. Amel2xB2]RAJ66438.1 putative DNA-binding transcriptional regulator YafY [Streptomyces sp. Amel2xB2]
MKSDRLLSILLLLQTRERVPADELARRLEVSTRTIYRDVDALSTAGVPVYAERGRHGGIALLPGFRTDVTGLTSDEARALFVLAAQGAHSALGLDGALGSALRKVMAALPAPHRPAAELTSRRILVDPDRWLAGPRPSVDLDTLGTAVFTDRRLRIDYRHGGARTVNTYTVDPYGLVAKAGTWYLVADRDGTAQLFRVDRVLEAAVTQEPVRRREGVELADAWEALRRQVEDRPAHLRIRARVRGSRLELFRRIVGPFVLDGGGTAGEAEDGPPEPEQEPEPEGWVPVELAYPVLRAVRQLLQFGDDVEVLEPAAAREELARAAASVTALYGAGAAPGETG